MVSQNELNFGDTLMYVSAMTGMKTPCIYVRKHNNDTAVILFRHAEKVARVYCSRLERPSFAINDSLNELFDGIR